MDNLILKELDQILQTLENEAEIEIHMDGKSKKLENLIHDFCQPTVSGFDCYPTTEYTKNNITAVFIGGNLISIEFDNANELEKEVLWDECENDPNDYNPVFIYNKEDLKKALIEFLQ